MSIDEELKDKLDKFRQDFQTLKSEISKVIVGQQEILDDTLVSLVAGGLVVAKRECQEYVLEECISSIIILAVV